MDILGLGKAEKVIKNKLSIVIPTSGRRLDKIVLTLKAILKEKGDFGEIVIVNQGDISFEKKVFKLVNFDKKVHWYNQNKKGKSRALNFAIPLIKGDIFVIVDDDVIVSENCFRVVKREFERDSELAVLFGRVKPYSKGEKKGLLCPSLSNFSKKRELTLGELFVPESNTAGSIMAIKREIFEFSGGFCEWLGVGTWVGGGEEWEFPYRLVAMKKKVLVLPDLIVYHNKFLEKDAYLSLVGKYYHSAMVVCFYLAIKYRKVDFIRNWNLYVDEYKSLRGISLVDLWAETIGAIWIGFFASLFLH